MAFFFVSLMLLLLVVICHAAETSEHHLGAVLVDTCILLVGTLHQQVCFSLFACGWHLLVKMTCSRPVSGWRSNVILGEEGLDRAQERGQPTGVQH